MADSLIHIEVAAAWPGRQLLVALQVPVGTTVGEAVERSGLPERLPELEIDGRRLGVFGRIRSPDTILSDGDRVEIYRPLTADPKAVRRKLAELEKAGGKRR